MTGTQATQDDLDQRRFGLRFSLAATERRYRHRRNEQNMPVFRLTTAVSLSAWLLCPLPGYPWRPDIDWIGIWWIG